MNPAKPPPQYDPRDQAAFRDEVAREDARNLKRGLDVEVGRGRLILTAPNGTRWALAVSNSGTVSASAV